MTVTVDDGRWTISKEPNQSVDAMVCPQFRPRNKEKTLGWRAFFVLHRGGWAKETDNSR